MGCLDDEEDFLTGNDVELRFSTDTLTFDTVFTSRGSATRLFKVYNDANDPVRIDRIFVAGRTGVEFTFNVDGFMGPEASDVVIYGGDSIFVFVEAEVDPGDPQDVSPFIAEDLLVFEAGENERTVVLEAFGQNALYLNGFGRGNFFQPICQDGEFTLPSDLPVVIYGSMVIDSCTVRALAGTRLYFHGGIQRNIDLVGGSGIFNDGFIFTFPEGRLELLGTREEPVLLAVDRLEEGFGESRGGYRGLIFGPGSRGNRIEHTELRNAIIGVTADSLAEVTIENSVISDIGGQAIAGYQSDITVRNSLLHSTSGTTLQFIKGGNLTIEHSTLANYGSDGVALLLDNAACDDERCLVAPLSARVSNSILAGGDQSELALQDIFSGDRPGTFDVSMDNTVVRVDERLLDSFPNFFGGICRDCVELAFGDDLFEDISEDDYRPDSLSVARGVGVYLPALPEDLDGNPRDTERPDAGALEWQPEQ